MPEIPEAATKAVEDLAGKGIDAITATKFGQKLSSIWDATAKARNMRSAMRDTGPAGEFVAKRLKEVYEPAHDKALQAATDKVKQGVIHNKTSLPYTMSDAYGEARNIARKATFGTNDALGAAAIKHTELTNGHEAAQTLADHISVYLNDSVDRALRDKYGKEIPAGRPGAGIETISSFKKNVTRNKEVPTQLNINAVYHKKGDLERAAQQKVTTILAPALAINHLSTPFNIAISTPLTALTKSLWDVATPGNYRATRDALLESGIYAQITAQMYREMEEWSSGKIATWSGSPKLGYYLNKAIHMPGFNEERKWTITLAGSAGKRSADVFAQRLIANPSDRLAKEALSEMSIEPREVLSQGGRLTSEQYGKAIYRFVDDRVFLNTKLDRSYWGQSNPVMRMTTMYHGYVAAQGHLLARELGKMWKAGDIANYVQTLSVLGILFPAVGHIVGGLERLGRGQTFEDPTENSESAVVRYTNNISHMAGFGVAQSYIRSTLRKQLSDTLLGPVGNTAVRTVEDSAVLAFGAHRASAAKQLGRDVLETTLPDNLGKILTHKLLPTTKEKAAQHPHLKKLHSGLKGLSRP